MSGFSDRLRKALTHRWFPWFLAGIAGLVHLPGIGTGYLVDDHAHRFVGQGNTVPGGPRGPWELYRFADGGAGVRAAIDEGIHAWWTAPDLKLAFLRPITSLVRVAEERLFHENAALCHLVSVLFFVATALAVWRLLAAWVGGAAGNLGALLFALDDAHSMPVLWIAARHMLIGTLFVLLGLTPFLRARARGSVSLASGAFFFLGLMSSESAVSGLAFFGAIALFFGPRTLASRASALAPVAVATLAWLGCYVAFGYGAKGSAYYVDPLTTPVAFAQVAVLRAPTLALAQLFGVPAEISGMAPAAAPVLAALGFLLFGLFAWLSVRTLPDRSRTLSLLVAFVLALVPACGTNSDDRLLVLPGVAAFGLLACWARYVANVRPSVVLRVATVAGLVVHVGFALLLLPIRTLASASMLSGIVARGSATLGPQATEREIVVLSAPDGLLPSGMLLKRQLSGQPAVPMRVLCTSPKTPLTVRRVAASVLELSSEGGTMRDPFVGAVRNTPFVTGDRVELRGLTVEVLAAEAGYPTSVRFTFAESIDDGSRSFLAWEGHRFVPVELPPVGGSIELSAIDFPTELGFTGN